MYRSTWELAAFVRDRIAYLADERQICSQIGRDGDQPASLLTQLRHHLGIRLIQVGYALASHDAVRVLPAPPARPATWGPGS